MSCFVITYVIQATLLQHVGIRHMTSTYCNFDARRQRQKCVFASFSTLGLVPNFISDNYEKIRRVEVSKMQLNDKQTHYNQVLKHSL